MAKMGMRMKKSKKIVVIMVLTADEGGGKR